MKKKTKILFTITLTVLSLLSILIISQGIEPLRDYISLKDGLPQKRYFELILMCISPMILSSIYIVFNTFLTFYFWRYEITWLSKDKYEEIKQKHLQRKEDKKKAKIEKMEEKIERLKDGK